MRVLVLAVVVFGLLGATAEAAYLGPKPRASCGWYMRGVFGGKYGPEFNLAQTWFNRLPRTTAAPGRLVIWTRGGIYGHVARIVQMIAPCQAIVNDNRGTYRRNICGPRVLGYVRA